MVGETNRAPFDLPEAEGELVGGFHTEYSSLKFALFFLAEYINMATVSAIATTLFLGGWHAPWPINYWDGANSGYWPVIWFFGKVLFFIFCFIWLRGTLPRLRYDQFMHFGWKRLIPVALLWTVLVAGIRAIDNTGGFNRNWLIVVGGRARRRCWSRRSSSRRSATEVEADEHAVRRLRRRATPCRRALTGMATRGPEGPVAGSGPVRDNDTASTSSTDDGPHDRARRADGWHQGDLLGPGGGFGVTFRTMFRKVVTEQYPFVKEKTAPRFHGRHQLNRWPDGLEKCIGCELCAWACPADAIYVEGASNGDAPTARGGSRRGSATAASTRSTTCAASCAGCASRPARPGR